MSIAAKLYIEDKEHNVLYLRISAKKEVDQHGFPLTGFVGGYFDIEIESTKDTAILQWAIDHDTKKDVKIVIPSRFGTGNSRIIELKEVYCIAVKESFISTTPKPMTMSFKLSPGGMYQNGQENYIKHWYKPQPKPIKQQADDDDKEKKVILTFNAKNDDIKNGKFGYDKFDTDFKKIYTGKDFSNLENEYKPIQVYGEKYFPVWISMRKGQTITLNIDKIKLGKVKTSNYKLFNEIKFADHPDFTFEPANLKDIDKVHITCKNNNPSTTQIKVEADGETVGAINFFYPEVKKLVLDWRFVELEGTSKDEKALGILIKKEKLKPMLKRILSPLNIDLEIENEEAKVADLTKEDADLKKANIILKNTLENYFYINNDRKQFFVNVMQQKSVASQTAITLYFINRRCISPKEVQKMINAAPGELIQYELTGGFSPTGNGVAYGVLDNNAKILDENIIHEVLHAIGLPHTFKEPKDVAGSKKHTFDFTKSENYMDYHNPKESIMYWQWQIIQDWINSNTKFTR